MRARALAGIAVAAWSKTAMVATAAAPASASPAQAAVPTPPPVTSMCADGPLLYGPSTTGQGTLVTISGDARSVAYKSCPSATLSLDATADNAHWKRIDSVHMVQSAGADQLGAVTHSCLPGNWTYRVLAVADDGSYKNSHRATFAC